MRLGALVILHTLIQSEIKKMWWETLIPLREGRTLSDSLLFLESSPSFIHSLNMKSLNSTFIFSLKNLETSTQELEDIARENIAQSVRVTFLSPFSPPKIWPTLLQSPVISLMPWNKQTHM